MISSRFIPKLSLQKQNTDVMKGRNSPDVMKTDNTKSRKSKAYLAWAVITLTLMKKILQQSLTMNAVNTIKPRNSICNYLLHDVLQE